MSNCTCGRTTRAPLCDGSHSLSEQQYKERTERLSTLFKKPLLTKSNESKLIDCQLLEGKDNVNNN